MSISISNTQIARRMPLDQLLSRPLFYFDLNPILERAGATVLRNPNRLQIVCENCVKSISPNEDVLFDGGGFYLVVASREEPDASRLATQVSTSLFKCFFGTDEPPPEILRTLFRKPSQEEIMRVAVDPGARVMAPSDTAEPVAAPTSASEPTASGSAVRAKAQRSDPIAELGARGIHQEEGFRFGFVPVYDLRTAKLSTWFCSTVRLHDSQPIDQRDSFDSIGSRDLPRIEQAMLLQALRFSRKILQAGLVAAVGTSVSFETLAWSKGRQFYQNALRAAGSADNPFLIVKIDMIPPGTPPMRLAELVAAIRPYTKRVFVHLPDTGFGSMHDSSLGAAGYVISARSGMAPEETSSLCLRFAKLCALQGALSYIDHIPDLVTARRVRKAGIRFGEGLFFGQTLYFDDTPVEQIRAYQEEIRDFTGLSSAR